MRVNRVIAWLVAVAVPAFMVVAAVVQIRVGGNLVWSTGVALLLTGWVGALLIARVPENRVGWLLSFGAVVGGGFAGVGAATLPSIEIPLLAPPDLSSSQVVLGWAGGALGWFSLLFVWLVGIPLLFPTGKPPSSRWRWAGWLGVFAFLMVIVVSVIDTQVCDTWTVIDTGARDGTVQVEQCYDNPLGIAPLPAGEEGLLGGLFTVAAMVAALGALTSMVVRFRRAEPVERRQVKWVLFSFSLIISTLLLQITLEAILGRDVLSGVEWIAGFVFALLPLSIAVAILRYRLYEIDRIISRTVGYTLVIAALAGVYGLAVAGIPSLVPALEDSDLLIAAATLAAFFLFNPLRKRLLQAVDRRFYRSRYDAQGIVDEFATRLRSELDLDELTADWLDTVDQAVKPASAAVWIRPDKGPARAEEKEGWEGRR